MNTTAVFRDHRVASLDRLRLKDAQLVVSQEALRRGALTSSEMAARSGPVDAVRVSVRSPLWATTLATVYFRAESDASEWAHDLLSRLPRIEQPRPGARAQVWHMQLSAARILGTHVVGGAVLGVLEPDYGPQVRAELGNGARAAHPASAGGPDHGRTADEALLDLGGAIALALKTVESSWITATVARVTRARSGNVFLGLEGSQAAFDAVVFAKTLTKIEPLPRQGDRVSAHVARVSLYQPRGQLSLVVDGFRDPERGRAT
jgi:hypothetical protein